jgi:phospholipase/lecithinase/hemolysin
MKTHLLQFNTILANHVSAFKAANAGNLKSLCDLLYSNKKTYVDATVMSFDSNTWWNTVLDSPAEYGFTNTTGYVQQVFAGAHADRQ